MTMDAASTVYSQEFGVSSMRVTRSPFPNLQGLSVMFSALTCQSKIQRKINGNQKVKKLSDVSEWYADVIGINGDLKSKIIDYSRPPHHCYSLSLLVSFVSETQGVHDDKRIGSELSLTRSRQENIYTLVTVRRQWKSRRIYSSYLVFSSDSRHWCTRYFIRDSRRQTWI